MNGLNGSHIASITISDNGVIGVTVAQLTSDATAIGKLANANATAYQLAVTNSLPNIVGDLSGLNGNTHVASLAATSGSAKLSGGKTIAAPAFALTGSSTVLTLAEILTYSGSFSEGAGSTVSISSGDKLTLAGTTNLSGKTSGAGTLALAGGSTTIGTRRVDFGLELERLGQRDERHARREPDLYGDVQRRRRNDAESVGRQPDADRNGFVRRGRRRAARARSAPRERPRSRA